MVPTINQKETGIHLRKIMDEKNLTAKDVQTYLGLGSVQSVYHWLNGISMPTMDNMYALSQLFNMSIDDMICGNRKLVKEERPIVYIDLEDRSESAMASRIKRYAIGIYGSDAA